MGTRVFGTGPTLFLAAHRRAARAHVRRRRAPLLLLQGRRTSLNPPLCSSLPTHQTPQRSPRRSRSPRASSPTCLAARSSPTPTASELIAPHSFARCIVCSVVVQPRAARARRKVVVCAGSKPPVLLLTPSPPFQHTHTQHQRNHAARARARASARSTRARRPPSSAATAGARRSATTSARASRRARPRSSPTRSKRVGWQRDKTCQITCHHNDKFRIEATPAGRRSIHARKLSGRPRTTNRRCAADALLNTSSLPAAGEPKRRHLAAARLPPPPTL